eukprot:7912953-Pyramimonas_sp.AAC.1
MLLAHSPASCLSSSVFPCLTAYRLPCPVTRPLVNFRPLCPLPPFLVPLPYPTVHRLHPPFRVLFFDHPTTAAFPPVPALPIPRWSADYRLRRAFAT